MAVLGFEGFDHELSGSPLGLLLQSGEWTQTSGSTSISSVGGLLGGRALSGGNQNTVLRFTPQAGGNYGTLICGQRFLTGNVNQGNCVIMDFLDAGTAQCGVAINAAGKLFFWRGTVATVLATGATTLVAGTWYYIEAKVKFGSGTSGQFEVRIEGITSPGPEMQNGATNTITTANPTANAVEMQWINGPTYQRDDFYLCDDSGGVSNNFLLGATGIRVETTFVNAVDTPLQFTSLDSRLSFMTSQIQAAGFAANNLKYFRWVPVAGGTFTGFITKFAASLTGNINMAIYADSGINQPGALLATATPITNPIGNAVIGSAAEYTFVFSSPATLVGGATYWIGVMPDTNASLYGWNGQSGNYEQARTYASGFPATASGFSGIPTSQGGANNSTTIYGWFTGSIINAYEVMETSFDGDTSYNYSTVSGDVDMFKHGPLSNNPFTVHGVKVSVAYRKDDNTPQQIRTKMKSGATMSNGTTKNVITSYQGSSDYYAVDPNTGLAWTGTTINAATIGYEHI